LALKFDIIIIGGGPAGSSAAIALLEKGYSVAIIEKTDYTNFRTGETVPPKINRALISLGITDIFQQQLPCNANISSWGISSLTENNFLSNPFGNGWHLNRNKFDIALIEHARLLGCRIFSESEITLISENVHGNWSFNIKSKNSRLIIKSRFAVDASGRNSLLIKKMGGKRVNHDHLIAFTSIQTNLPEEKKSNYTLIEAVEKGWWYCADLPGNKIVFNYMTDPDLYKADLRNSNNLFQQKLHQTKFIKKRLENTITDFRISSANTFIMDKQYGKNWLSIGDAAMAYDPLSSSGILRAINDGVTSSRVIADHFSGSKKSLKYFVENYRVKYKNYLHTKALFYRMEKRWPNSLFWQRRKID